MKTLPIPLSVLLVSALMVASVPFLAFAQTDDTDRGNRADKASFTIRDEVRGQGDRSIEFKNDEIIVKFAGDAGPTRVATRGRRVVDVIGEYRGRTDVEYAEPNYIAYAFATPNDPLYSPYQWNFDNLVSGGVHAETAWDTTTGEGVVVAIVDTGVAYEDYRRGWFERYTQAPDLAGTSFIDGYDFVNNDTHANDDQGHGTHVAGTIAGTTNNNEGVAGLAHGATIMPIKVLASDGSGGYADVADGIRYAADNGANVINLSLGGPTGASYLEEAVCYAKNKGVTVVVASGNDGANTVSYPAAYNDCVIAVGATRFDETRASYSNGGTALDIVAPGGDTGVDQNGDGWGDGILQQTFGSNPNTFGYYFYQGTSMATPHVAAAAALVIAAGKASTPDEVQSLLESTADDLGPTGFDTSYGHGLLNLAAALSGSTPPPPPDPNPGPDPEPTPNQVPTADAGADQHVSDDDNTGEETVTLDGTNSSDDDGSIVSYDWFEGATYLGNGATLDATFDVGVHDVTLVVVDDGGASSSDAVMITVDAYEPPPPPPPPPSPGTELFFDGFENGIGSWTQDSQDDWQGRRRNAYSGNSAAEVDGSASDALLISPNFSLSTPTGVRVSFVWFIERQFDRGEYLALDISTDGGATWQDYAELLGDVDTEDVWHAESITLSDVSEVQIRFRALVSSSIEDAYLDDVLIETL